MHPGGWVARRDGTGCDPTRAGSQAPAFITFDAKLACERDRWSVALIGKNLADERCFEPFPSGAGTVAPGEPRTVYVVATVKY